jgi:hypothetical protein
VILLRVDHAECYDQIAMFNEFSALHPLHSVTGCAVFALPAG